MYKIEVSQYSDMAGHWVSNGYYLNVDSTNGVTAVVTESRENARGFKTYKSANRKAETLRLKFRYLYMSFKIVSEEDYENNKGRRISDFNYGRRVDTRSL